MEHIKDLIKVLPNSPGVYQFYDKNEEILYVGKAKNLKNRVSSYFIRGKQTYKTDILVKKIANIKHIVVDTETDALLLENNLIKKLQPKYNVLLKDDKTFPWIAITNEDFPKIISTRKKIKDGSIYYGPYTSAIMVRTLLEMIRELYPIRTCNLKLSIDKIKEGKFNKCLEYHLGKCLAPCIGEQSREEYNENIANAEKIIKGNIKEVIDYLKHLMKKNAEQYRFEEAEKIKNKLEILERYKVKSTIVNPKISNIDVFGFVKEDNYVYVNYIKVIDGAVVQSLNMELQKRLDEDDQSMLQYAMLNIREEVGSASKEVLIPFKIMEFDDSNFIVPKIGDKKKLLELSNRNANNYRIQKRKVREGVAEKKRKSDIVKQIKIDLRLKEDPVHMECFDNSNIQGTNPVAACVVFRNGKPFKSDYRHYNIKTVEGANDFASMEEIVYRRYKRLLDEKAELPQLIVIDGGKGQLSAAVKALKQLDIYDKIAILGIAKRLEELYFPGDSVPLYIDKNSKTLKILQHMRNEAHRFGITFHRKKREQNFITSELNQIPGIGDKTCEVLLKEFGSVSVIKLKSVEELEAVISNSYAKKIVKYFKENQAE
ncbi:MAG: excinuclease ABC subunit UvrC [Bacteroidales bacterium]|nr:excinuclease ABC subunit UvrC [Bacteroidales bacterium]